MGQLVDQQQRGFALEGGIEVELLELGAAILDDLAGQDVHAQEQRLGLRADVLLGITDDDIGALGRLGAALFQHGVGLADAGGRAEEDLELAPVRAALFLLKLREQGIRIGAVVGHHHSGGIQEKKTHKYSRASARLTTSASPSCTTAFL